VVKYNRVFRTLVFTIILSLLMIAVTATPALAQTVDVYPASGPVGTTITVTGTGFTPTTGGWVWFDSDNDSVRDTGEPQRSVTTTAAGAIPAGITLTVPTVTRGTYQVQADIPTGAPIETSSTFDVTPQITLSPSSGYVGDTVTVSGSGFNAGSVTIYFDTTNVRNATANASGTFSSATFTVPESYRGDHTVKGTDASGSSPTVDFTVSQKITVTPASGGVGDTVSINGSGFAASSTITFYFDTASVSGTTPTNNKGSFTFNTFTIPSSSRGSHTIKARDDSGNYATAAFTVAHKITIAPTSGVSGTKVTVKGTGFSASQPITIRYRDVAVTTTPASISTDANGSFTASFTVPAGLAGTYPVEVSDGTYTASANFTATIEVTITPTSEASPGHVGMEITISGTGFKPSSQITITYVATPPVTPFTTTSGADGSFSYTFTVPPSKAGPHTITASDGTNTLQATFIMELTAPAAPKPLLPAADGKAKSTANFKWEGVTKDVNGADEKSTPITYDLQIATDKDFTKILLEKTGLTTSAYTLTDAEKLKSTNKDAPYYWRIRAIDAASNASDWSGAGTFYVGFIFPEIKGGLLYGLIGAGVLLLFFLGFWAGRKSKGGGSEY
jgi:hypothetical protein